MKQSLTLTAMQIHSLQRVVPLNDIKVARLENNRYNGILQAYCDTAKEGELVMLMWNEHSQEWEVKKYG